MMVALLGISVPNFFLGLLGIIWFAVGLGWLPTGGYIAFTDSPLGVAADQHDAGGFAGLAAGGAAGAGDAEHDAGGVAAGLRADGAGEGAAAASGCGQACAGERDDSDHDGDRDHHQPAGFGARS